MKRLRQLEAENLKLKRLVAERLLEIEVMREVATKRGDRERTTKPGGVRSRSRISQRRACRLLSVARSALRYESKLALRDAPVVAAMRELGAQYPRYGYRRIPVFLERRGLVMSADRVHRIWRRAGLQVPRRRPRRRVATSRPRPLPASGANQVWAYDFVHDACANGQTLKCLTLIDEYTRECLTIDAGGSIRSSGVIEVLAKLVGLRGAPRYIRSDNGPKFVSRAILRWLRDERIETALIDPGKPWQNGSNESFNGKLRDECLGLQWFRNRSEVKGEGRNQRLAREYNEVRPHSSLGELTPTEFAEIGTGHLPKQSSRIGFALREEQAMRAAQWLAACLGVLCPIAAQAQSALGWEAASVVSPASADALAAPSFDAAMSASRGTICAIASPDGLLLGGTGETGQCEVLYRDVVWRSSRFDVLTGAAGWEAPVEPDKADELPESRMVVAGYSSAGVAIYPCSASGVCRRWSSGDSCSLDGSAIGRVDADSEGNAACLVADIDHGTCVCGVFEVLVAQ